MKTRLFSKIASFAVVLLSYTALYAQTTVTLTQSSLGLTGSYTSNTEVTIDDITYVYTDLMKNSNNIQAKASSGVIYNTTAFPGNITSVAVTHSGTARATTIFGSSNGTDWTQVKSGSGTISADFSKGSYTYFKITRGANAAYWTQIVITYTTGGGSTTTPSISASDVNLAYDATNGSIDFTVNNPVDGGVVTAVSSESWLTVGTITASSVPLTCSANETTSSRSATVTLTYTYNTSETVTKDVTVTQAAAPVSYSTIPDLFAAATKTETSVHVTFNNWVVSGVSTNGKNVFVTDNNGNGFVIFDNKGGLGNTYASGSILSGTAVPCSLKLYNGFAELVNLDAADLTITPGGTVSPANVELANLSGVNTGALLHYENLTCSVSNNKYYVSDGNTTLQVYEALYTLGSSDLEDGKMYNITGVYQQYSDVKEILPRSADDIEEVVVTTPSITVTPNAINATCAGTDGTINVTCENMVGDFLLEVLFYESDGTTEATYNWFYAEINNSTNNVDYIIDTNAGEARTAYFKVYGIDEDSNEVYSELVTVYQAEYVAPALVSNYSLFSGDLVEGDYIIVYDGRAMNTTIDKNRLQYEEVVPAGNTITTGNASIVWHIAKSGEYWTIYNAEANSYAASTGTKNQAQMLADGTGDMALWTVSGTEEYEFVNKKNAEDKVNSFLRNNGAYGFACYAQGTGGDLKLYKFVSDPTPLNLTATFNGGSYWATYYNSSLRYKLPDGARAFTMNADHQLYLLGEDGSVIPANTAVIIIADHANLALTNVANAGTISVNGGANILTGSDDAVAKNGSQSVLGIVEGVLNFYRFNGENIPAHRAYINE